MSELWRLTATEAVALLKRGEVTPLDLIDVAAARIAATDGALNALPTLCLDRARDHARRLMARPRRDPPPHYLYGLPIAVKDNMDVAGVRCTSGSRIYENRIAEASDIVVERLEVFGVTRNPWDTRMTPSGSSGGAAAALASGQVWLATGGDFGGSIRTPSSYCSTVGLRPTPGSVPRAQKQPFSALSVEGPMARTVGDCALMFECEAGAHPLDPLAHPMQPGLWMNAAARPQKPARVAFSVDLGVAPAVHRDTRAVVEAAAKKIAGEGVIVEETHPDLADAVRNFMVLRGAIYIARIAPLLAQAVVCPPFPVETRYVAELDGVKFDGYMGWLSLTCALSITACPVLALPGGFTPGGLPVGLQVAGPLRSEARLFSQGAWLEQLLGHAARLPIEPVVR